ncbi:MAG: hypothetical protein BA863_07690 [Desulfovibrio sp. S3730MH75]|nr:MAG: hypothetical protein BA863_07690 [Desulfovibrio sp. S3730MH75]
MRIVGKLTRYIERIVFKFLPILIPIGCWWFVRDYAAKLVTDEYYIGAAITLAPVFLFAFFGAAAKLSIRSLEKYYFWSVLGVFASGGMGLYREWQRWEPFIGQQGYTNQFIAKNLNWPLVGSSTLCLAIVAFIFIYRSDSFRLWSAQKRDKGVYGSAAWMSMNEAKKLFSKGSLVIGEAYDPSRNNKAGTAPLLTFDGMGHLLTVAGSGAGKSVSIAIPNVLNWKGNLVVHDPKGELAFKGAERRRELGHNVVVFNPFDENTDTVNVIDWLSSDSPNLIEDVEAVVGWLMGENKSKGDTYFDDEGAKLVQALLLYLILNPNFDAAHKNLRGLRQILTSGEVEGYLQDICNDADALPFDAPVQYARELLGIINDAPQQWAGILGQASRSTGWLSKPSLCNLVSGNPDGSTSVTVKETLSNTDVFISIPVEVLDTNPAPARILIGAITNCRYKKFRNGVGVNESNRTLFLLDEMTRLQKFKILETALEIGRSAGIILWAIIQDFGGLERYWGVEGKKSWLENTMVKNYFGVNSYDTAKMLSDTIGKKTVTASSVSKTRQDGFGTGGSSGNVSYQSMGRELMTPDEIMNMKVDAEGNPDEQLVFVRNQPPLRCGMAKYYRRVEWAKYNGRN